MKNISQMYAMETDHIYKINIICTQNLNAFIIHHLSINYDSFVNNWLYIISIPFILIIFKQRSSSTYLEGNEIDSNYKNGLYRLSPSIYDK